MELGDNECNDWVELEERRYFCRVLFPNPVCFLSVVDYKASRQERKDLQEGASVSPSHNVMVLSWLTSIAGNENGRFAFSLNKRRHTASMLDYDVEFCLSIPVRGMEELVCNVGSTSGRWGSSKFPCHHVRKTTREIHMHDRPKSKRARRKEIFASGITGLYEVPLGRVINEESREEGQHDINSTGVFAIAGTVAHLRCKIVQKEELPKDDDHYFVVADITRAFVLQSYWDGVHKRFGSKNGEKPTLSFFGSQTFGYLMLDAPMLKTQTKPDEDAEWIILTERKQFSRLLYTNALCLIYGAKPVRGEKVGKVLSHLTATNNEGSLMISIDRSWIDKSSIEENSTLTLYIPTSALEEYVKGLEKLTTHKDRKTHPTFRSVEANAVEGSNRRLERSKALQGSNKRLERSEALHTDILEGTVAKLSCTVESICNDVALVIFARVESALVHSSYWDNQNNIFRPQSGFLSYMKYLRHQNYGYLVTE